MARSWQRDQVPSARRAGQEAVQLLDYYMREKLRAAGALGDASAPWVVSCFIDDLFVQRPPAATEVRRAEAEEVVESGPGDRPHR